MEFDSFEISLRSADRSANHTRELWTQIVAYPTNNEFFDENTLVFDCDPIGTTYSRAYYEFTLKEPAQYELIHDFIEEHLRRSDDFRRRIEIPVRDGQYSTVSGDGDRNEVTDVQEVILEARGDKISVGPFGRMSPKVRIYEQKGENGNKDRRNGEKLLSFFDQLRNMNNSGNQDLRLHDGQIVDTCVPHYLEEEYPEACRKAAVILEERVTEAAPDEYSGLDATDMMHQVFSADDSVLGIAEQSSEQKGLMYLFAGAYLAIRNPLTHRTVTPEKDRYLDDLDEIQCRNILHMIDYLLTLLSRSEF